jgi:hypothetical protein
MKDNCSNGVAVLRWCWLAASADSDESEAWGRWGRERGASPEWENWIRGVGMLGMLGLTESGPPRRRSRAVGSRHRLAREEVEGAGLEVVERR